jgi:hypothetical protein
VLPNGDSTLVTEVMNGQGETAASSTYIVFVPGVMKSLETVIFKLSCFHPVCITTGLTNQSLACPLLHNDTRMMGSRSLDTCSRSWSAAVCTMPSLDIPFSTTGNCSRAGTTVQTGYQCSYQCSAGFNARPGTSGTLTCNNGVFTSQPTLVCQRV